MATQCGHSPQVLDFVLGLGEALDAHLDDVRVSGETSAQAAKPPDLAGVGRSRLARLADGGEHVFFHDGEIVRSVRPRPGRVILWAGAVQHAARPPLPDAGDPRLSIGLEWAI